MDGFSSKHTGRGLGVSTAKKYIESIRGKIILMADNMRTTARISLPVLIK